MKRAQQFLMSREDLAELGRLIVHERPSVRSRAGKSREVFRSMPVDDIQVLLVDAELAPGYDLTPPELRIGDEGRTGEMGTVFNNEDPGQRAFVDAAFRGLRLATKPHVEMLTGQPTSIRIGPDAERWWRESQDRIFRHARREHRLSSAFVEALGGVPEGPSGRVGQRGVVAFERAPVRAADRPLPFDDAAASASFPPGDSFGGGTS